MATLRNLLSKRTAPSLLALCIHLPLVVSGLPLSSFDAYTHIFFADHYRLRWFDLLEPRWFGGFSVASYPPLVHQLIALISMPVSAAASLAGGTPNEIRFRGETGGYSLLLLIALACLPGAVERFSAIFVPERAARAAAWLSVGLPSVYLAAYSFGQLPTLAASALLMWALAGGWQYCRTGRWNHLLSAVSWAGVTAAAHHAVAMFAVFAGAALAIKIVLSPSVLKPGAEPARASTGRLLARFSLWAVCGAAFGAAVMWPFIQWGRGYVPQTPIDHLSRHNYFTDWLAAYYFFWPMYGPVALALPVMLGWIFSVSRNAIPWARSARRNSLFLAAGGARQAWRKRRHWPLLGAALALFVLGLGGTTPLPRLFFGLNWEWLTFDRFSLWAGFALLPFAGLLSCLKRGYFSSLTLTLLPFCLFAAFAAKWVNAQPPLVDVETLARFLDERTQGGERYLTFGFGDQLARLSVLTDARTVDGAYFTARAIPELRESGIGAIDGALWNPKGVGGILPLLGRAQFWGVRWALTAHPAYVLPLARNGWQNRGQIVPGVWAWYYPAPWVSTEWSALVETDARAGLWWGIAPLAALAFAALAALANRSMAQTTVFTLALLIVAWPFWYYAPIWSRPREGVYFTYTSGLAFVADGLAGLLAGAVLLSAWQSTQQGGKETEKPLVSVLPVCLALIGVVAFAFASASTSTDPVLSAMFAIHLCAMGAAAWAAARAAEMMKWEALALAMTVGLVVQSIVALAEVSTQSTGWLASMGLPWPGVLTGQTAGASVVSLSGGARWLRAYGTLPHPNVLGGYLLVTLAGPFIGYLQTGKLRWLWPLLFGVGALFLTFSRAAWLAGGAALVGAGVLLPVESRRRWAGIVTGVAVLCIALAVALGPLVLTRITADSESRPESFSITHRRALTAAALTFVRERPLTGVGAGAFVAALAATSPLVPEPVHNVILLAAAETGLGGGAAVMLFGLAIVWRAWRRRGSNIVESALAAGVMGLIVIAMFDHFAWSLSAGRLLAAMVVGLWVGRSKSRR